VCRDDRDVVGQDDGGALLVGGVLLDPEAEGLVERPGRRQVTHRELE
jgi:hypothetical protein